MILPVTVDIETGEPLDGGGMFGQSRWARLRLNGVTVFSELVYDADADGNRTDEWAAKNLLLVLQSKTQRLAD